MTLQLIRKEIYLSFLLSILLFVSINILSYNHIVLGKGDSKEGGEREEAEEKGDSKDDNRREEEGGGEREEAEEKGDSKDDNRREEEGGGEREEAEDFEDITIEELFDDDNEDNIKEENNKEKEEEDDVPFRLPFRAVPFP